MERVTSRRVRAVIALPVGALALLVLMTAIPRAAEAQRQDALAVGPRPVSAFGPGHASWSLATGVAPTSMEAGAIFATPAPAVGEEKSPFIAGTLSLLFPGAGSFYAGNARHGWIHVGVTAAAAVTVLASSQSCKRNCPNEVGATLLGFAAFAVNEVWSIVTAVNDANASNRRLGTGAPDAKPNTP